MPLDKIENIKFSFTVHSARLASSAQGLLAPAALPRGQAATWAWAGNEAHTRFPPGPDLARLGAGRP